MTFVAMARALADDMPNTTFRLVGPDEGEGASVANAIAEAGMGSRLEWIGALPPSATAHALSEARVYVLPAVNEVFPMSIIEAFAAGTPVVTTNSLGMAADCRKYRAAMVTDGSVEALADAVRQVSSDSAVAEGLRTGAADYLSNELNIERVVDVILNEYLRAIDAERFA